MKRWRSFIVLCGSLILAGGLFTPKVQGCSYTPYENVWSNEFASYHISFYPADLGYERLLAGFMFRANPDALGDWDFFSRGGFTEDVPLTGVNLEEWVAFLSRKVDAAAIKDLVYGRGADELGGIHAKLLAGQAVKDQNKLVNYIRDTKQYGILEYIIYAKRCEPFAAYDGNPWDFAERMKEIRKPKAMQGLIDEGVRKYAKEGKSFLKLRYAYQVVRLAHYAGLNEECVKLFDGLAPGLDGDSLYYYQALRHKAGALLKLGHKAEAMVLFSLVFDQCPALMLPAYRDMKRLGPADWQECLRLAGHPHRQATLWLLSAIMDGDRLNQEPLARIYGLEPRSLRLEFLLARQVNKIEKTLLSSDFFSPETRLDPAKTAYIQDLSAFVEGVDPSSVYRPIVWRLTAGYLNLLLRRYDKAEANLAEAEAMNPGATYKGQIALLRNLAGLARAETMRGDLEGACLPSLQWLDSLKPEFNHPTVRRSFLILMAQKYFEAKEDIKGLCCLDNTGYPDLAFNLLIEADRPDNLARMLAYAARTGKTPTDAYLVRGMSLTPDDLRFMLATMLLCQGRLAEALPSLDKISPAFWSSASGSIYPIHTSFETSLYNAKTGLFRRPLDDLKPIDKHAFVKEVGNLLAAAARKPAQADVCYYRIANGFFHSPAWSYYQEVRVAPFFTADDPNPRYPFVGESPLPRRGKEPADSYSASGYPTRVLAWQFYEKAAAVTKNPELAAECFFLAAAAQTRFSHYKGFTPAGKGKSYYYDLLRRKYAETRYYQKIIKECADLKDYLAAR